jgi:hypothetical protein
MSEHRVLHPDPNDDAWQEFCDALWQTVGRCERDYSDARRLLAERGFDVEASLASYAERGGGCDCEIRLNLAEVSATDVDVMRTKGLPTDVREAAVRAAINEVERSGHLDDLDHENAVGVEFDLATQLSEWAIGRALARALRESHDDDTTAEGSTS